MDSPRDRRPALPANVVVHREPGARAPAADPYRGPGAVRDDLLIEIAWRSGLRGAMVGFMALWWTVLAVMYAGMSAMDVPRIFSYVLLLFVAAGLGMAYWALGMFVNRSVVSLRGELLAVRHGPLPWPGAVQLAAAGIEQLYVREDVAYEVNHRPVPGYSVVARQRGAPEAVLVRNLPRAEQARYLEWVIEDALRVADRPVPGELRDRQP